MHDHYDNPLMSDENRITGVINLNLLEHYVFSQIKGIIFSEKTNEFGPILKPARSLNLTHYKVFLLGLSYENTCMQKYIGTAT